MVGELVVVTAAVAQVHQPAAGRGQPGLVLRAADGRAQMAVAQQPVAAPRDGVAARHAALQIVPVQPLRRQLSASGSDGPGQQPAGGEPQHKRGQLKPPRHYPQHAH